MSSDFFSFGKKGEKKWHVTLSRTAAPFRAMDINAPVLLEPIEHTLAHAVAASRPPRSQTPDQGSSRPGAVRIGLVCMMRDPPALRTWLRHYVDTLRVERFYILADDSPGTAVAAARERSRASPNWLTSYPVPQASSTRCGDRRTPRASR